ncbi:MAG TPA: type II toxin-antitoxin system prevent-host-death family antitoxin [Polyangia bacterium]|jgi:prevent-host-death family protein|nr:type II toxin-antitoxin system prevent-host-death family antitoxin [Polyangia bacterium]
MTVSVTEFKIHCLELLRRLEKQREPIEITSRGKVIARLVPPGHEEGMEIKPWERLRGSGRLLASPGESVLSEDDFDALR